MLQSLPEDVWAQFLKKDEDKGMGMSENFQPQRRMESDVVVWGFLGVCTATSAIWKDDAEDSDS